MYASHSANEYKQWLELSTNYHVDGLLAYGTWDLLAEDRQLPYLKNSLDNTGINYTLTRLDKPLIGHCYEIKHEDKVYWFSPVMGTAVMAVYIYFASLFGSKRNILLGVVGGLAHGMKSADFVIPTAVEGNDNARYYDRTNSDNLYRPDEHLLHELKNKLNNNEKVWEGKTTTCEMMLAETKEDIDGWSENGFLGVEMEAAIFFAASRFFNVPSVSLLYVGDNLIENESVLTDEYAKSKNDRDSARQKQYDIGTKLLLDN